VEGNPEPIGVRGLSKKFLGPNERGDSVKIVRREEVTKSSTERLLVRVGEKRRWGGETSRNSHGRKKGPEI